MLFSRILSRVFYGWWIVGASFIIAGYIGGAVFYGFTAIFEPIAADFHWSYTQVSVAASIRGLEEGLLVPITGALADRIGPRRLILGGAVISSVGLFMLGHVTSLAMFYLAYVVIAAGASCFTNTVLVTAIANWFRKRVGLAAGIATSGFGFGGVMVGAIVKFTDAYGWQATINALAAGVLVVIVPLAFVFRHRPEQYGCLPDGQIKSDLLTKDGLAVRRTPEISVTLRQALRGSAFWRMAVAFTLFSLVISTIVAHSMPYLSSVGVSRATAGMVATLLPLSSVFGRAGLGWLGDRRDRRKVCAIAFLMVVVGMLCFARASAADTWLLVPFLALFGVGYGGCAALRNALGSECFGRRSFGAIFGSIMGINQVGAMTGPLVAGWVYDTWGSYVTLWFLFSILAAVALVMVWGIPRARGGSQ